MMRSMTNSLALRTFEPPSSGCATRGKCCPRARAPRGGALTRPAVRPPHTPAPTQAVLLVVGLRLLCSGRAPVTPVRGQSAGRPRPSRTGTPVVKASSKWSALMDGPLRIPHRSKMPAGHPRGGGSSPDAEEMLSRMLENVLHIQRQGAIYDLARDGREPSVIGLGVVDALSESSPQAVIVMGTFAARAMLGDDATVGAARGPGQPSKWSSGSAGRASHTIPRRSLRWLPGEARAKREAFEDLKAVMTASLSLRSPVREGSQALALCALLVALVLLPCAATISAVVPHAETDALALLIDLHDANLDLLTLLDHGGWVIDVVGHLRDVHNPSSPSASFAAPSP